VASFKSCNSRWFSFCLFSLSKILEREKGELKVVQQFNWWTSDWLLISPFDFPIHVLIFPLISPSGIFFPPSPQFDDHFLKVSHWNICREKKLQWLSFSCSLFGPKCTITKSTWTKWGLQGVMFIRLVTQHFSRIGIIIFGGHKSLHTQSIKQFHTLWICYHFLCHYISAPKFT